MKQVQEYLTYDDKVITAFFFSTSNGKTENCEEVFSEKLPYVIEETEKETEKNTCFCCCSYCCAVLYSR